MKKISLLLVLLTLSACGNMKSQGGAAPNSNPTTATLSFEGDPKVVVAEIGGTKITEADLNKKISSQLTRLKSQLFEIQQQGLNGMVNETLLEAAAKKANTTLPEYLKKEVEDKVGEVPAKDIEDLYNQNKARLGGKTLDEVKPMIQKQLLARQASVYRQNLIDRLRQESDVKIFLTRPTVDVSVDDDAMMGDKDAPITIIEFTDYECPFCNKVRPTIKKIMEDYKGKVRYVLRDFPLDFHRNAKKAAEAASCAGEQNKYWEYGDILWANQKALTIPDLKKYAADVKLDQGKFDQCLDSGKYSAEVEKDTADGAKVGVSGTPAFFINGQMLTGARPYEQFKEVIDMELLTKK